MHGKTEICLTDNIIDILVKTTELQIRSVPKSKEVFRNNIAGARPNSFKVDLRNLPEIQTSLHALSIQSCGTSLIARKLKLCKKHVFVMSASDVQVSSRGETIASVNTIGAEQVLDGFSKAHCHNLKVFCQNIPQLYADSGGTETVVSQDIHGLEFALKKISVHFEGKALRKISVKESELNCCRTALVKLRTIEASCEKEGHTQKSVAVAMEDLDIILSPEELSNCIDITKSVKNILSSPATAGQKTARRPTTPYFNGLVVNAKSARITLFSKSSCGKLSLSTPNVVCLLYTSPSPRD